MRIEKRLIKDLKPAEYNPRKSNKKQEEALKNSLEKFGAVEPIIVNDNANRKNIIIGGHFRVRELKKLGYKEIDCVIVELTLENEKELNIRLNANTGEWDFDLLKINFDSLDLNSWGLEMPEISFEDKIKETIGEDDLPEEPDNIITKLGDLYELGNHKLLCGDSRDIKDFNKLMDDNLATMIFTDPPYNVKISSVVGMGKAKHQEFKMASGEMTENEFVDFLVSVFANLVKKSIDGSIHYVCMDWKHIYEIITAGRLSFTELKNLCVWNKDNGGMGAFYRSKHELVFVFKNGSKQHINNFQLGQSIDGKEGRYRTNVWDYRSINSSWDKEEQRMHPTVKPVELIIDAILDCSNENDIILDCFGGSGSTLIACEKSKRKSRLIELEEKYCDVIVRRYINFCQQNNLPLFVKRNGVDCIGDFTNGR